MYAISGFIQWALVAVCARHKGVLASANQHTWHSQWLKHGTASLVIVNDDKASKML
jgi:hypothetical protein